MDITMNSLVYMLQLSNGYSDSPKDSCYTLLIVPHSPKAWRIYEKCFLQQWDSRECGKTPSTFDS